MKYIIFCLSLLLLLSSCNSEDHIRSRVVKLLGVEHGSCSGTQVRAPSGTDYILTAGHCRALEHNGTILAKQDDDRPIARRVIEESQDTDLLLLEGLPNLSGLPIATVEPKKKDLLRSFTHGSGLSTYKTTAELIETNMLMTIIERILNSTEEELTCTGSKHKVMDVPFMFGFSIKACVIQIHTYVTLDPGIRPGSSGGGVFNASDELTAVAMASDETFASLVTLSDIKTFLKSY